MNALLVLSLFAPKGPSNNQSHTTRNHYVGKNQYRLPQRGSIYEASYSRENEQDLAETEKSNTHWALRPEWMIVWVTLLYTFVSFIALIALWRQVWLSQDTSKRQLRAYLSVGIGEAIYQADREPPLQKLLFEARPILINTGQTPAYKIRFKTRAAILPIPLPKSRVLPEGGDIDDEESILGPHQNGHMFGIVDGYCLDEEVETIRHVAGDKGLYVWGLITYEDAFGDKHFTRFCQQIYWTMGNEVRGTYVPGRNNGD